MDRRSFLATAAVLPLAAASAEPTFGAFTVPGVNRIPEKTVYGNFWLKWTQHGARPFGEVTAVMSRSGWRSTCSQLFPWTTELGTPMHFIGVDPDGVPHTHIWLGPGEAYEGLASQVASAFGARSAPVAGG